MDSSAQKISIIEKAWPMYESAFPECERRSLPAYRVLCSKEPDFVPDTKFTDNGGVQSLMWYWNTPEYTYLEHFAVTASMRNHGVGGELVQAFLDAHDFVALEVEPPTEDIRRRRIGFYQRHGLVLNDFSYINPGYKTTPEPYPLCVMSSKRWSEAECRHFVDFIMARVLKYID